MPYSHYELYEAHENLLIENKDAFGPDDEMRSLINVSRGTLPLYENILPLGAWAMITCFPLKWIVKGSYKLYQEGVKAHVTSQRAIPSHLLDARVKNRSRLHYRMAQNEVDEREKGEWAILLDTDGFITEGTGSNFFIVRNRRLMTPNGVNCLRGISRQYVMDLAKEMDIESIETNLTIYDMLKPVEKELEIVSCKLVEKTGGKSDFIEKIFPGFKAAVLVLVVELLVLVWKWKLH